MVGSENFKSKLADIIAKEGYCPEQVFNADETALLWTDSYYFSG